MRKFMDEDFLLYSDTAKHLFHDVAKDLPIYDYHCHLNPSEIYEDRTYENITQIWLGGDHYKWRQMRICGIDENLITGDAPDREKFRAYASIMPEIIGNPLYHWSHLELQRFFNIYTPLSPKTADEIYDNIAEQLKSGKFTARQLITMSNVSVICTTDDPVDSLEYHIKLKAEGFGTKVLPTFRPDKAFNIADAGFVSYIKSLPAENIDTVGKLMACLYERIDFFASVGCVISDHAFLEVPYAEATTAEVDKIFKKRLAGEELTALEAEKFTTYVFMKLCEKYYELGWTVQIHVGALRNNNKPMFEKLGPDTGYDSIDDACVARKLSALLGAMHANGKLPKSILYTLKPSDNYTLSTMLGNFAEGGVRGKIQFGSAWWFYDHYEGMNRHFKDLASLSSIGTFVGMLTDSRSFLSYPRHEYFRRIVCNILGEWVESGQYPNDDEALTAIVKNICCDNIKAYLGF